MKITTKKCVFILPYFGRFNNYFPLFLKSCEKNPTYNWLIFTDCKEKYNYPENVDVVDMTLQELKKKAEDKFGFQISMETPYKLCDYKPSYGFLFEEYIQEYEYWGHCDCDLIFGNLEKMLTPLLKESYDKIFAAGHLTIYKNNFENNRRFMKTYKGELIYKKAFTTDKIYAFDEDCIGDKNPERKNVHSIFFMEGVHIYDKDLSMNTSTTSGKFINETYNNQKRMFYKEKYVPRRYYWSEGTILSVEWNHKLKSIKKREYLYMHFQMRKMRMKSLTEMKRNIQILPDRFITAKKIPDNKKELKIWSIKFTYLYFIDVYMKKIKRKSKKLFGKN